MNTKRLLIVEDEDDIVELLTFNLKQESYDVISTNNGNDAIQLAIEKVPDLILLDIMIPGKDGFEVCKALKANDSTSSIPIIMLTAKSQEHHVVSGLELGASDYITKPFSIGILVARIRATLRHQEQDQRSRNEDVLRFHDLEILPKQHNVKVNGQNIALKLGEFKLLQFLAEREGWVFTRNQLLDASKGEDSFVTDRSIDVMMVSLRKKLGPAAQHIETVRGVGYRFNANQD